MAIADWYEIFEERSVREATKGVREMTRKWIVTADENIGPCSCLRILRDDFIPAIIPAVGDYYKTDEEEDKAAICKTVSITNINNDRFIFGVSANYSSEQEDGESQENPLSRPPDISYKGTKSTVVYTVDSEGKPVLNSSDEPFEEPLEKDDTRPTLTITRNEAKFVFANAVEYQDAVNQDVFFGADPGKAKIQDISAKYVVEGVYAYWNVTYEIQFRRDGWLDKVMDRGYRSKTRQTLPDGSLARRRFDYEQLTDANGQPLTKPVKLDGQGKPLEDGKDAVYLDFKPYKILPFKKLRLPRG